MRKIKRESESPENRLLSPQPCLLLPLLLRRAFRRRQRCGLVCFWKSVIQLPFVIHHNVLCLPHASLCQQPSHNPLCTAFWALLKSMYLSTECKLCVFHVFLFLRLFFIVCLPAMYQNIGRNICGYGVLYSMLGIIY